MAKQKQAGFAIIEAVLIVVVLALLGGVGYYVVNKNKPVGETANQAPATSQTASTPTAEVEQSLNQAAELESATEDSSSAAVESEIDAAVDSASNVGDSFNENDL